jgi:hypothetical protein
LRKGKEEKTKGQRKVENKEGMNRERIGLTHTVPGRVQLCGTPKIVPYTSGKSMAYLVRNIIRGQLAQHVFR